MQTWLATRRGSIVTALVVVLALMVGMVGWSIFMPASWAEYHFRSRLSGMAASRQTISLDSLFPSPKWELACDSHGYAGPLYLKEYNRTFPPAAPSADGAWGIIFIEPDGSYTPIVGSCGRGGTYVQLKGCVPRQAVLTLQVVRNGCPEYVTDERSLPQ
jgi:hypothetical protein